jgi:hypothetical protein
MIIAVTGGRYFSDVAMVDRNLRKWINPGDSTSLIIHGGARGADTLAGNWGKQSGVHIAVVNALWDWYGKAAGHMRNDAMTLLRPELLLAFPGGRGTADMVTAARRHNISVRFAE